MEERDVVIIGGGPAGFMAAQRVAMGGVKAAIIERECVGGICPVWGCMPMCFMDHCVDVIRTVKNAPLDGIDTGEVSVDYARIIAGKDKMVAGLTGGMEAKLRAAGMDIVIGNARLTAPKEVSVTLADGSEQTFGAKNIIICAGSAARRYDVPGANGDNVLAIRELLALTELPRSLAVIGRGVAALELATVWANLGTEVSLLARQPRLLPNEDAELAGIAGKCLAEDGVKIYAGANVEAIEDGGDGKRVVIATPEGRREVTAQYVVFALGQRPATDGLGLENAGVALNEDGAIQTNAYMATSVPGVYAAGDVTGGWMLASIAMKQGLAAAANALGGKMAVDYGVVPRFIRTLPPLASVGITEEEAAKQDIRVNIGRSPFAMNPKAGMLYDNRGLVKIIAAADDGRVLGVHILGIQATELIHEAAAIIRMSGTAADMAGIVHAHPCLAESVQRAAAEAVNPAG